MLLRIIEAMLVLMVMFFLFPIIKDWYDIYSAPTTGILIGNVDDTTLAIMTFIPWYIPIIVAIAVLLFILIPKEPENPQYPRFPVIRQPKQPKKRPPII